MSSSTHHYDDYRGWLKNKRYADSKGPDYTYTDGGRLKTRKWARGGGSRVTTTYEYGFDETTSSSDDGGDLIKITYTNDGDVTPDVTYEYFRDGKVKEVLQNGITLEYEYTDAGQVDLETYTGSFMDTLRVDHTYDTRLRRIVGRHSCRPGAEVAELPPFPVNIGG